MKSEIKKKINEEYHKSINLRELTLNNNISFDNAQKIRKEQKMHYDKYNFFKNLKNTMERNDKNV